MEPDRTAEAGWLWDGPSPTTQSVVGQPTMGHPGQESERTRLARACARVFRDQDGAVLLAHLRGLTSGRVLGPEASDATLRFLEGQRALMAHLDRLIAEGRAGG